MHELYKVYRPRNFDEIIGSAATVKAIEQKIEKGILPHFILLTGPSGCGKTTVARIIKDELKCGDDDFLEFNCANRNGVELAREIERDYRKKPIGGGIRIYYLDECHQLTRACEESLLKPLEDTPAHCYFIFATTDPQKIIPTIKTRATEYKMAALSDSELHSLLDMVCESEEIGLMSSEIKDGIVESCAGSARLALVLLDKIIDLNEDERKEVLEESKSSELASYELLKALFEWGCNGWAPVATALANNSEDPEGVRRYLRACAMNQLLDPKKKNNHKKAFEVLQCSDVIFYDKAALVQACFDIMFGS